MMKKLVSMALMAALMLSMVACGSDNDRDDDDDDDDDVRITAVEDDDDRDRDNIFNRDRDEDEDEDEDKKDNDDDRKKAETTVREDREDREEKTEATTTAEPEEELPLINRIYGTSQTGWASIRTSNDKYYLYNMAENTLVEYDTEETNGSISLDADDATGNIAYVNSMFINLSTGKPLDTQGATCLARNKEVILFGKVEESFSGNTVSLGVVNGDGEWVYPLSSDYAICSQLADRTINDLSYLFTLCGSDTLVTELNSYYVDTVYSFSDDKVKNTSSSEVYLYKNNVIGADDNYLYYMDYSNIYKYSISAGTSTPISEGYLNDYVNDLGYRRGLKDTTAYVCDKDYNITTFDVSAYDNPYLIQATSDMLFMSVTNPAGTTYLAAIKPDGSTYFEPVKLEYNFNSSYILDNNYIVTLNTGAIINLETGEIRWSDDTYDIVNFDVASKKVIVETADGYYMFADVTDPDTLINPFEIR
ncbi:MAG: hypothetical protein J6K17_10970 [Oscillospiraceae bacterium]|nr:hypothetical protein [Oscillospiraceae bacterium]